MGYMTERGRRVELSDRDIDQLNEIVTANQKTLFTNTRYPEFFAHTFNSLLESKFTPFSLLIFREALNQSVDIFNMITDIPDFLDVLMLKKLTILGRRITEARSESDEPSEYELHQDLDMADKMWSLVQMITDMTGKRKNIHFFTIEVLDNLGLKELINVFITNEPEIMTRYNSREELMIK
jgi:hypothetical protein